MLKHRNSIKINATTTGFASPAETYVDKRLDLNELIVKDIYTTFYFKYSGPEVFGVKQGDTLVIDKSEELKTGDLVVLTEKTYFKLREYKGQNNIWGKVTWILKKI